MKKPRSNTLELIEWLDRYLEGKSYQVYFLGNTSEWTAAEIGFLSEQIKLIKTEYMNEGDIE